MSSHSLDGLLVLIVSEYDDVVPKRKQSLLLLSFLKEDGVM